VNAVVISRVPRKAGSYLTSTRTAVLHTVSFQDHSPFVEKRQRVLMRSSRSSDLLDWASETVSQKDVRPVTSNANELLFHSKPIPWQIVLENLH
jgi:hypothetical protein